MARGLGFAVLLLVLSVGASGCLWTTHLTCHGGREGTCSLDSYGLFTTVGHVDVPVREIVHVNVDERAPRRGPSTATIHLLTRSMGRIDLAGGQRLGGAFGISDALAVASALRPFEPGVSASPRDVDLWIGPSPVLWVIVLSFAMICLVGFVATIRSVLRDIPRSESDA